MVGLGCSLKILAFHAWPFEPLSLRRLSPQETATLINLELNRLRDGNQ